MKNLKAVLASILAAACPLAADAAVTYDFTSISASDGVNGSFSLTLSDFPTLTRNGDDFHFTVADMNSCSAYSDGSFGVSQGPVECAESYFSRNNTYSSTGTYDIVGFGRYDYPGQGRSTLFYYFPKYAFSHAGTYTSSVLSNQIGTLMVSVSPAVPEPITWAMLAGGVGVIGASMRWRKRKIAVVI